MKNTKSWGDKPFHSFDYEMKKRYGRKVYKLSFDCGMTCPNRDGTAGTGGCIFCSAGGSGDFAAKIFTGSTTPHIEEAVKEAKALVESKVNPGHTRASQSLNNAHQTQSAQLRDNNSQIFSPGYIAYFQSFSNTYADVEYLKNLFTPFTKMDDILAISIATRPDCLPDEVIGLLTDLNSVKPIWVELGLQTIHEDTAKFINRGYSLSVYDDAVKRLRESGIEVITHVILGLPGETSEMMLDTVKYVSNSNIQGIKLQLLHILQNTKLAEIYEQSLIPPAEIHAYSNTTENCANSDASKNRAHSDTPESYTNPGASKSHTLSGTTEKNFHIMEMDEYLDLVTDCVSIIPPEIVIHRLTGDGFKRDLIAPKWSGDKKRVLNTLSKKFKDTGIYQGCNLH